MNGLILFTARFLVVATTIFSLVALAPAVAAASPRSGELHVTKDCSSYTGAAGDVCTITSSNLNAIKVGSRVIYAEAADFRSFSLHTDGLIDGPGKNDAFGHVTLDLATGLGSVTISGGDGVFTGFSALGAVSPLGGPDFAWDGTYSFSPLG
jgi:hypothetical protein